MSDKTVIEVFKTDVREMPQASQLRELLQRYFPGSTVSSDLDDSDKVLRIEGSRIIAGKVKQLLEGQGFICEELS